MKQFLITFILLLLSQSVLAAPAEVLWHKMNDDAASTAVTDDGTTGNSTSSTNTSDLSVSSFVDAGLDKAFDFTSDRLTTTLDMSGFSDITVTFWADFDAFGGAGADQIFNNDIGSGASNEFVIDTTSTNIRSYFNLSTGGAQIAQGSTSLSTGTTYFFSVKWDSSAETICIYIDGSETADDCEDLSDVTVTISSDAFVIGQRSGGAAQDFAGTLEDLRVFDAVLTNEEDNCIYNSGAGTEDSLDTACSGALNRRVAISIYQ